MNRKYANLRLESLKNTLPAAVGAAFLFSPEEAAAAPVTLSSSQAVHAGGAEWIISNSTSAVSSVVGLGIPVAFLSGISRPAFDGAFVMTVNGTAFKAPNGVFDLTGTTVTETSAAGAYSGLTVSAQFYFVPSSPTVRVVYTYTNPTGAPINVQVQWQNYLGFVYEGGEIARGHSVHAGSKTHPRANAATSSGHTVHAGPKTLGPRPRISTVATSSGDGTESAADHWAIFNNTGEPFIDMVRYGPGASNTPVGYSVPGTGNNLLVDGYSITVPPGQSRMLMFFARLSNSQAAAIAGSGVFNSVGSLSSAGLLTGLTAQQEAEIVNWSFPAAPTANVPALGTSSFLLLASLVAALGAKYLRWPLTDR
jgi:hypothetical protein